MTLYFFDDGTAESGGQFGYCVVPLKLPSVQNILNNHVRVEGYSACEFFAWHAMHSVALVWVCLLAVGPWDIVYCKSYDVIQHCWKLVMLVSRQI